MTESIEPNAVVVLIRATKTLVISALLLVPGTSTKALQPPPALPRDYQGWSDAPGPDSDIQFVFGRPYLIASLKTDLSGVYAPHAFRGSNGAIFVGYYAYSDEEGNEGVDPFPAILLRSTDDGVTWRSLTERGNLGYMFGETSKKAVLAVDCMWQVETNGDRSYPAQKFVTTSFAKPAIVTVRTLGFAKGEEPYFHLTRMVRAKNGSLVTVAYTPTVGPTHSFWYGPYTTAQAPARIVCLASEDEGLTWQLVCELDSDARLSRVLGLKIQVSEPFVEALPDGRLLCLFREETSEEQGPLMQCWSSDSGKTWTIPISSGVVGIDPCLVQMKNGVLLGSCGRPDVRLMYSLDGGAHWKGRTTLYHYVEGKAREVTGGAPGERLPYSHGYTSMVALSSDRLLFFFDIHEHLMPWTGMLPTEPARRENRSNSIFAVPIQVIVSDHK